jgi:hypothetical protein
MYLLKKKESLKRITRLRDGDRKVRGKRGRGIENEEG